MASRKLDDRAGFGILKGVRGGRAMAAVFIVLGVLAIAEPAIAGLAMALLVGWVLIVAGVSHLIAAFIGARAGGVIWPVVCGVIYVAGGIYFVTHPLVGLGALTILLAAVLLAEALFEFVGYLRTPKELRSGWILVNGVVTVLLAALIWLHWPSSSEWAIGTLVGLKLLITGISLMMLAGAARRLATRPA